MGKVEFNIGIDAELLAQAQAAGVSVEAAAEAGVRRAIAERDRAHKGGRALQWAKENADAIEDHRARIADGGIFGADLRTW
jgi:post-segregation antitoxin (ccd killing protein)